VVAEAGNGVEAVDAFERYHPDVTLLDLRMPVMEGVEAVRQIRERDPRARVIVLTTYDTDDEISRALKAGAKAYVLKDISADDLIGCIRDVLAGKTYLAPAAAAKLAEGVTRVQLTPREMATLRLMADGKANKEIASELSISERTVKTHLGHLFEKLGVGMEEDAVDAAVRNREQQRREWRVLVIENQRRLAIELVHFGLEVHAAGGRRDERGDSRGAGERRLQIANARGTPAFSAAVGDHHGVFGQHRDERLDVPVGCGAGEGGEEATVFLR